jgi:hydrogenase expression/formation protein HypC
MCLAIPALVVELHPDATVSAGGVTRLVSVALLDEGPGDYVLLHVGYALHKVSVEEAEATLRMMAEAGLLEEELAEWSGSAA